ncbi:D-amino-acid dehydrogenase [Stella humosa]|uniref:D-amino-acid dehydrogenase n=1 Tax=Stella humosa TaxID=94 RepID=A0A3N1ME20_9PROT|nr:FAD-dependent oxidoreductase [Stella humosa]ROQ01529.1 D-amino-acid dehydrogenase [Stella humosa]BBK31908.1 D-amino-acid dehydrogenase [Stella humosa]
MTALGQAVSGKAGAGRSVTVVGAGIVGVGTGIALQRAGFTVTLVDRQDPGRATSFGNAGILSGTTAMPLATPGILKEVPKMLLDPLGPLTIRWSYLPKLAPWLMRFVGNAQPAKVEELSKAIVTLSKPTVAAWMDLAGHAGAEDLIERKGWVGVYEGPQAAKKAAYDVEVRVRHDIRAEMLTADEVRQLVPGLARTVTHGVFHPDAGHTVSPIRLTERLVEHFLRSGGKFVQATVQDIGFTDGRPATLVTDKGPMPFDNIVIAAGAWSKRLVARLGHNVPLETERGYHAMVADPGVDLRLPVSSSEGKFFLTPMADGIRVAGTVELAGLDAAPNWKRADALLEKGRRLLPGMKTDKVERWLGFRPTLPDSLPVIGPSPKYGNVFFAFGHHHLGLTQSAMTGRLISQLMTGNRPEIDIHPYRVDRF